MADRYWVGGTGTWDNSTTSNWSTTSGGSGGASVPRINDIAIFDANSGSGLVTISFSGAVSLGGLDIGTGSTLTFEAPTIVPEALMFKNANNISVKSSALVEDLNIRCVILTNYTGSIDIDRPFFTYIRFGDGIQSFTPFTGSIEPLSVNIISSNTIIELGDFSTAIFDNVTITFKELRYDSVGSYGASTTRRTTFANNSILTATSHVSFPSVSQISGPSNFTITDSEINAPYMYDNGSIDIQSNTTWKPTEFFLIPNANNLIIDGTPSSGIVRFANTSINDSIVLRGTSSTDRLIINTTSSSIFSNSWVGFELNKPRIKLDNNNTITVSTSNTTFENIDFWGSYDDSAGANTGITGTSIGISQYNSGVIGETPRTLYFEGSDWDSSASWSSSSGGSTGEAPPLPQDTVYIESNKTISFSKTRMMPILETADGTKLTVDSTADIYYNGTTSSSNTSIDSNAPHSFILYDVSGEWGLKDDNIFVLSNGRLSSPTHNISIKNRNTTSADGQVFIQNLGNGTINFGEPVAIPLSSITTSFVTSDSASTNFNITGHNLTSFIANSFFNSSGSITSSQLNNLLGTFTIDALDVNDLIASFKNLSMGNATIDLISGQVSVNNVEISEFTRSDTTTEATLTSSLSQNFTVDIWSAEGVSPAAPLYITGDVQYSGIGVVEATNLTIENSDASPADTWYAINSVDNGNNTGWIFQTTSSGNGLFWSNF